VQVTIIYADHRRGVQKFGHLYKFQAPDHVSADEGVVLGRVSRYTDAEAWGIITGSQGELKHGHELPEGKEGLYSPHMYFMNRDPSTGCYNCKVLQLQDCGCGRHHAVDLHVQRRRGFQFG